MTQPHITDEQLAREVLDASEAAWPCSTEATAERCRYFEEHAPALARAVLALTASRALAPPSADTARVRGLAGAATGILRADRRPAFEDVHGLIEAALALADAHDALTHAMHQQAARQEALDVEHLRCAASRDALAAERDAALQRLADAEERGREAVLALLRDDEHDCSYCRGAKEQCGDPCGACDATGTYVSEILRRLRGGGA